MEVSWLLSRPPETRWYEHSSQTLLSSDRTLGTPPTRTTRTYCWDSNTATCLASTPWSQYTTSRQVYTLCLRWMWRTFCQIMVWQRDKRSGEFILAIVCVYKLLYLYCIQSKCLFGVDSKILCLWGYKGIMLRHKLDPAQHISILAKSDEIHRYHRIPPFCRTSPGFTDIWLKSSAS